jgi:hypothetical protein
LIELIPCHACQLALCPACQLALCPACQLALCPACVRAWVAAKTGSLAFALAFTPIS